MNSSFLSPYMAAVIAHRGASGHAPENTAAAITKAAELKATWVEVDITISADGTAVVFHDNDVNRCTDGRGLIVKKTLQEIQQLDAGTWYSPFYAHEPILTLAELLKLCDKLALNINIEIKPTIGYEEDTVDAIKQVLAEHDFTQNLLFSSFNERALRLAASILPHIPRALNSEAIPKNWRQRVTECLAIGLHFAADFADEILIKDILTSETKLACYTVNDIETARYLWNLGVSSVFTDYPDRLCFVPS